MKTSINFVLDKLNEKDKDGRVLGKIKVKWMYGYSLKVDGRKKPDYIPLRLTTGIKISVDRWDVETQRITTGNDRIKLNAILTRIEQDVLLGYHKFMNEGVMPSPDELKKQVTAIYGRSNKPLQRIESRTSIQKYIEHYIDTVPLKGNTKKGYVTTTNKLDAFQKLKKVTLYFETLTTHQLVEFFNFCQSGSLRPEEEPLSINGLYRYKRDIRKFINLAKFDKVKCDVTFYKNPLLKIEEEEGDNIALTIEQIKEIVDLDLKEKKREGLQTTKDLLLISCLTGLRFSDWGRLGKIYTVRLKSGDNAKVIRIRSRKDDAPIELPVFETMLEIYNRNGNEWPKPNSNQKYNENVKMLGTLLDWDEIYFKRITRIEKEYEEIPFNMMLSSHVGRRSFCTNSYRAGFSTSLIMDLSGHDSEESFLKYIKSKGQDLDVYYETMKKVYAF